MVEAAGCVLDDATTLTTTDQHHLDFLASRCRSIPLLTHATAAKQRGLTHAAASKRRGRVGARRPFSTAATSLQPRRRRPRQSKGNFFVAAPEASEAEQGQTTMEEQAPSVP
jgi:hypothetical protein